jgi:hypothetical protein
MGGERDESRNVDVMLTSEDRRRLNGILSPQVTPTLASKPAPARR